METVRIGVIEVAETNVRLLVAASQGSTVVPLREERATVEGPADLERVNAYSRVARDFGVSFLQVLVTGAAATTRDRVRALADASGAPVRVLSPEDEATLIWQGAVVTARWLPETVAVCNVAPHSTTVVVGTMSGGPVWLRSLEIGAADVTERFLREDQPSGRAKAAARAELARHFDGFVAPLPKAALATPLDMETFAGGVLILAQTQRRLGVPFRVAEGGLREGAALALLHEVAAA